MTCTSCERALDRRNKTGLCRSCTAKRMSACPDISARRDAAVARQSTIRPDVRAYVVALLKSKSTDQIVEAVAANLGITITKRQVDGLRWRLKNPIEYEPRPPRAPVLPIDDRSVARDACDTLLRRHLLTGQHWISDPARFATVCADVGLAA